MTLPQVGRYWRTLRHLKLRQVSNRLWRRLFRPRPAPLRSATQSRMRQTGFLASQTASILAEDRFRFLNRTETLQFPADWQRRNISLLWQYNLHYFEGVRHGPTPEKLKSHLLERWIADNPAGRGIGWDPYPLSLRVANWIIYAWTGGSLSETARASLYQQADFLSRTLEFHLLGNHLLENAKALVFAGCFFSGKEPEGWLKRGLAILERQLSTLLEIL